MTRGRLAGIGTAVALGMLLTCGLTSCTLPWKTASPWSKGPLHSAEPTAEPPAEPTTRPTTHPEPPMETPAPTPLSIPAGTGDLIRLIYSRGGIVQSDPVALPESSGYAVSVGCLAETPDAELTYTLTAAQSPSAIIQSATTTCDGTTMMNETSVSANVGTVRLWLSGDLDVIDSAFAILTPTG